MLEQMSSRLQAHHSFEGAISQLLADTVALQGAEFGNVQLLTVRDTLIIVAERGLEAPFLLEFREVAKTDGCACGRALKAGQAVVIEDVMVDEEYELYREAAREAGYRSVQSTPLRTSDGVTLYIISTLFANKRHPTQIEMQTCGSYCRIAADYLQKLSGKDVERKGRAMHDALYAELCA